MSAVALPFDSAMGLGPRPAPFTWPAGPLEPSASPEGVIAQEFPATYHHGSEPSLTPPSVTSSLTSSPPRHHSFTPQHREFKRQQDRARRDSRLASRLRRVSSQTSYMESPSMSPIPDVTTSMEMPSYSASTAPVSLLSESAPIAPQPYMPSYSPPLQDPSQAQMFPTSYAHSLPQSYGMPIEYSASPYPPSGGYSSRSSSLSIGQESGMVYQVPAAMTSGGAASHTSTATSPEGSHVRVVQSRPKPKCWDHGCNGRQFSTFSNLLRHQREKSGQANKASCPNCGAEFTRTTARNGHMLHDKCKQRRNS
ncbi:uncharacterized protein J7T54_006018 [Emericellopsis cladophorae]|uniref:Uncharacterized protein n=1 Tax=Emericellopsis cladophorae TaxID=2686198 RepID=A0A9P9YA16_9HYPO|nr:uncharacterized protein J7T54_006018 [Emericellopsis cladophorae]KAI6785684.1 hypothetical protein J7T54_006018 [Emericellopsis cladophorae]